VESSEFSPEGTYLSSFAGSSAFSDPPSDHDLEKTADRSDSNAVRLSGEETLGGPVFQNPAAWQVEHGNILQFIVRFLK